MIMREQQSVVELRLSETIEDLHRSFGGWSIAWALLRAIRKDRHLRQQVSHLSDQMLVDIGLPERRDTPFAGRSFLWAIRKR